MKEVIKGRYKIYDKVGSGGMATVYIARDLETYEVVAIKVLKEELITSPNYVKRFLREAEVVYNMKHENITSVKDFGIEDNTYFIVMEYVEGKTLSQLLEEKGKFEIEEAIDIIIQVLKALQYAHDNGIEAHRDIKPQNIMIDKNKVVKVMDFGIARISTTHTLTQEGSLLGTPDYVSPEQAQGKDVDIRSDIYSVGITLFQLINGSPPFEADTPWGVINMHLYDNPPLLELPERYSELSLIINRSLAKEKDERYQTPNEFIEDLNLLKKGKPLKRKISKERKYTIEGGIGELFINTKPEGVKIFLDGVEKGETPILLKNLASKKYNVELVKDGFKKQILSANVLPDRRANLNIDMVVSKKEPKEIEQKPISKFKLNPKSILFILIILIASISLIFLFKPKEKTPINQPVVYGTLFVNSKPSGLDIYLDGNKTDYKTPYTFTNLSAKNYTVEVKYNDELKQEEILLNGGDRKEVIFEFNEVVTGNLKVESEPTGAKIFIDDNDTGNITPYTLNNITSGEHNIKLTIQGYEDFTLKVNIPETKEIKVTLNKIAEKLGTLKVQSEPQNAEIYINNEYKGKTPFEIKLSIGKYNLKLKLTDYDDWQKEVEIKSDEETSINATLSKTIITVSEGTLKITSTPKAYVYINNQLKGQTPLNLKLAEAEYKVKIYLEGYETYEKTIKIVKGEEQNITVTLKKIISKTYIKILTDPENAEVYIDKIFLGLSGDKFEVKPGKHEILIKIEGYIDYLSDIDIKEGETKTINVTLEKIP